MNKNPIVSIYIPVYNHALFLEMAIKSVLDQTFKDWELIIINDGSNDDSENIIKKYESYHNVTIVNQENKGLTVTCNIAIRISKGKYIIRLDGDDYLDENALLIMTNLMEEKPEIGLVYPDYYLVDVDNDIISLERREKLNNGNGFLYDLPPHGACTMYRKQILIEIGGYSEEITCQDNYDIWFRFINNYKADNINLPLFYYRRHGNNSTNNTKKILENRQKIKRKYSELKRKKVNESGKKRLAIIPTRSHAIVMDRMALQKIAGRPMIDYTIKEAEKSNCFDHIAVTSEDNEIIDYVKDHYKNIKTINRPQNYARRNTSLEKTVKFVLEKFKENGEDFDEIMLLFIEAPLKKHQHIIKAIDTMNLFDTESVVSVCETNSPYYMRGSNGLERIGNKEKFRLERKYIYRGNGALLLFKTANLTKGTISGKLIGHIIMLREESINIRSEFDFNVAEYLIKKETLNESSGPIEKLANII